MNSAKKPTCEKRRSQTRRTITRRAGMPEPARLGPRVGLGFACVVGAATAAAVATGGAVPTPPAPRPGAGGEGAASRMGRSAAGGEGAASRMGRSAADGSISGTSWSSAGTRPGLPVFHGIGSGWSCPSDT